MDDTPDKLRRNVVALSAAILAVFFLNLTFKPSASLLGIADVGNLAAWKVWLCLSVVLVYIFLRYRFDEVTEAALKAMGEEYDMFVVSQVARLGQARAVRLLRRGRSTAWIQQLDSLKDERWYLHVRDGGKLHSVVVKAGVRTDRGRWESSFIFHEIEARWDRGNWRRTLGEPFEYRVPGCIRVQVIAQAGMRSLYSKSTVDVAVPMTLAALAAGVCLIRLGGFVVKLI